MSDIREASNAFKTIYPQGGFYMNPDNPTRSIVGKDNRGKAYEIVVSNADMAAKLFIILSNMNTIFEETSYCKSEKEPNVGRHKKNSETKRQSDKSSESPGRNGGAIGITIEENTGAERIG